MNRFLILLTFPVLFTYTVGFGDSNTDVPANVGTGKISDKK